MFLIDDDNCGLNIELKTFVKNIKKEVIMVVNCFLSLLTKYNEKIIHNILTLVLNPRFKSLNLTSSFIGHEYGVVIVEEHDKKSMFLMFLKSYHHLHLLYRVESSFVHKIDEDNSLDIFEMVANILKITKEFFNP
jgi:hypothetical protein